MIKKKTCAIREALLISLGGIIFVKLPVLLLINKLFSLTGIWLSEAVSELILCIISLLILRKSVSSY